jgi:ABC-type multidrug transport system ATPase subunit
MYEQLLSGSDGAVSTAVDMSLLDHCESLQDVLQSQRAPRPPVTLEFQNLSFSVGDKRILHDLNGTFSAGELTALMGPSGAGKSTLLNVLAGYRTKQSEGRVLINGEERVLPLFRKFSCFVMQDDALLKNLTVLEYLTISSELRLPEKISAQEKTKLVTEVSLILYFELP